MLKSLDHFKIGAIEVFVNISLTSFNFAKEWSKYMANLAASRVTLTGGASSVWLTLVNKNTIRVPVYDFFDKQMLQILMITVK